jgi:hypothetical protein
MSLLDIPSLHKVHKIEETFLVMSLLSCAVDSLNTKVLLIITEFPVIRKGPVFA